jgi:hypothetical protein
MKRISIEESQFYIQYQTGKLPTHISPIAYCFHPVEDNWEKVRYYGDSVLDINGNIRKPEWIYILVNSLMPGIIKIGMTTTSVEQRLKEINSATGVIMKWNSVYQYKCVNAYMLEQEIHRYLQDRGHRINPNREGFEIDVNTAINYIELLGERYQTPFTLP